MTDPSENSRSPVIWERPEPKGPLRALSREIIANAAIDIADKDGLGAVSLRKVAAALQVTTMRLYSYLSTKEELLELMVDSVYGEMLTEGAPAGDWREALRAVAYRTREAARRHKWFIELSGGRPQLGPNAIVHLEASYAMLSNTPAFQNIDAIMQAVAAVNAYVVGAILNEANERRAERESGMDPAHWQAAWWPYLQRLIATGRFPLMERVIREATHPRQDEVFERGLDCVIEGISHVLAPSPRRP